MGIMQGKGLKTFRGQGLGYRGCTDGPENNP